MQGCGVLVGEESEPVQLHVTCPPSAHVGKEGSRETAESREDEETEIELAFHKNTTLHEIRVSVVVTSH